MWNVNTTFFYHLTPCLRGASKKFGEWKHKTNKTKHGNKIPLFTLKVTFVDHNTLLTSLLYRCFIVDKAAGLGQRRPLLASIEAQMSHVVGCLVSLQNVCPSGPPWGEGTKEVYCWRKTQLRVSWFWISIGGSFLGCGEASEPFHCLVLRLRIVLVTPALISCDELYTHFLLTASYPYTFANISWVSVAVLPNLKQNLMLCHCSMAFRRTLLGTLCWNECNSTTVTASRNSRKRTVQTCPCMPTLASDLVSSVQYRYIRPFTELFRHTSYY